MSVDTPPSIKLNGATEPTTMATESTVPHVDETVAPSAERPTPSRADTTYSKYSMMSVPPEGSILTGKQEHCMHSSNPTHGEEC
jgi:hypothetical protein